MGCQGCKKEITEHTNMLDLSELLGLFDNPKEVEITAHQVVYYRGKWILRVTLSYQEEGETTTRTLTIGELN